MTDIEKLDIWNQPDEGDPLIWIHRVREQHYAKYPTPAARQELYSNPPSLDERRERVKKHIHEKLQQGLTMKDSSMPRILTPETPLLTIDAQKTPSPAMRSGLSLIEILAAIFILMVGIMGVIAVLPFGGYQLAKMNRADYSGNCGRAAMVKLGLSGLAENPFPIAGDASSGTQRFSAIPIIFDPKQSSGTITNQLLPVYDSFGDTCEWQDDIAYGDAVKPEIQNQRPQMVGSGPVPTFYGNYTWFYMLTPNVDTNATITGSTPPTVDYTDIHSFDVDVIVCQRRGNEREVGVILTPPGTAGGRVTITDGNPENLDLQNTDWILITAQDSGSQVFAKWYRIVSKGDFGNMEEDTTVTPTIWKRELMLLGPDIPAGLTNPHAYIVEGASWVGSMTVPKKD